MKQFYTILAIIIILMLPGVSNAQNIFPANGSTGMGTLAPDASSMLEINSTTKGMLIPRMTKTQRDAIAAPATGLMIYQTNSTPGFYYFDGSKWAPLATAMGANKSLSNLTTTSMNQNLLPDVNNLRDLGSNTNSWKDIYTDGSIYMTDAKFLSNGGGYCVFVGKEVGNSNAANYNCGLGYQAFYANTTGNFNTASGTQALYSNTTGSTNTALGMAALYLNTMGGYNTAVGVNALYSNTEGFANTASGVNSLYYNTTGNKNAAFGYQALNHNTTGHNNVAIGTGSLFSNTTGHNLVAVGDSALFNQSTNGSDSYSNTAVGSKALFSNTTGSSNSANGFRALYSNTTGFYNTANGFWGLYYNTTGAYNTANGSHTLYHSTTGSYNTANGFGALYDNTTGSSNTANGVYSLSSNTNGNSNTANGYYALSENITGSTNTANGVYTLPFNTSGHSNVAIGAYALYNNTNRSNLVAIGDSALFNNGNGATQNVHATANTAVGSKALYSNTTGNTNTASGYLTLALNTTGSHNVAYGAYALYSNTTGQSNIAIGTNALYKNTTISNLIAIGDSALLNDNTGGDNVAIGSKALKQNDWGHDNTAVGTGTLSGNTDGQKNTAMGKWALLSNVAGYENTGVGYEALYSNSGGRYNAGFGTYALKGNISGYLNSGFGVLANVASGNLSNATAVGADATVDESNKVRIGNTSVTSIGGQVGWSIFSDGRYKKDIKENVPGLKFINALRPITYTVDINGLNKYFKNSSQTELLESTGMDAVLQDGYAKAEKIIHTGFIAQEVEATAGKLNYDFSGVDKPEDKNKLYGLRYDEFVVPLVKAVQELSKQNDELKSRLDKMEAMIPANSNQALNNKNDLSSNNLQSVSLGNAIKLEQNIPNPFAGKTTINYTLPTSYTNAQIIITDKSGNILNRINITGSGKGSLNVNAPALTGGTYNYSLLVSGKIIETKQMILAK